MDDRYFHEVLLRQLLSEVSEEEIVELLQEVILEDNDEDPDLYNSVLKENAIKYLSGRLVEEIVHRNIVQIAEECFDEIVAGHQVDMTGIRKLNRIMQQVSLEMVEEIVLDVIGENVITLHATEIRDQLLEEFLVDILNDMCSSLLDHYLMRAGISRFRHIQASAASAIMDQVVLNSLLKPADDDDSKIKDKAVVNDLASRMLNEAILDVLLSQSLTLHACFPKNYPSDVVRNKKVSNSSSVKRRSQKSASDIPMDELLRTLTTDFDNVKVSTEEDLSDEMASSAAKADKK